jgi:hypothetical protein
LDKSFYGNRHTDRRHQSEYNSPSLIPFFITIVIIKEGRTKKKKTREEKKERMGEEEEKEEEERKVEKEEGKLFGRSNQGILVQETRCQLCFLVLL